MENKILFGCSKEKLKLLADNSIDSIVTDPPYELGFMGKSWDSTGIAYDVELWKECLRVLKHGGHLLAFGGTRTYHRMAVAIEDAGFEVRDMIEWIYGCLSDDTEILTKNGWEQYRISKLNSIFVEKEILIYDTENDIYKWEKPQRWNEYSVNEDTAYRIKSDTTDQIVSRNHRCLVKREGKLIFVKAETLQSKENIPFLESLPMLPSTFCDNNKRTGSKKQVLFNSMLKQSNSNSKQWKKTIKNRLSDMQDCVLPNISKQKQAKSLLQQKMCGKGKRLAKTLFGKREREEKPKQRYANGEKPCMERRSNIHEAQGEICKPINKVCEMPKGVYTNGKKRWICNGTPTKCSNRIKKALNKIRVRSSYKSQCRGQQIGKPNAIQHKCRTQEVRTWTSYNTTLATIEPIEYTGVIFCPTVSTGAFVARRNGKAFLTGNSGFPKSLNIGKKVDEMQGNEREWVGKNPAWRKGNGEGATTSTGWAKPQRPDKDKGNSEWEGWGTALKPSHEPICLARKPIEKGLSIAENCLKWGVGGINIDESRVGEEGATKRSKQADYPKKEDGTEDRSGSWARTGHEVEELNLGRFPANLIHDNSEEVQSCFPTSSTTGKRSKESQEKDKKEGNSQVGWHKSRSESEYSDSGNASRFFKSILYYPKASKSERNKGCEELEGKYIAQGNQAQAELKRGNTDFNESNKHNNVQLKQNFHATVKPVALISYLIILITPKGGTVLDPFGGSGTTAVAAIENGFKYILIEKEAEHIPIIEARVKAAIKEETTAEEITPLAQLSLFD